VQNGSRDGLRNGSIDFMATKILCVYADHLAIVKYSPWPVAQMHRHAVLGNAKCVEARHRRQSRKKSAGGNTGEKVGVQSSEAKDAVT
jgi:hypothetical protein